MTDVITLTDTHVVVVEAAADVELIVVGIAGPQGIPGTGGGGGGSASVVTFTQSSPSLTWTIVHNLGRAPVAITVTLLAGTIVEPDRQDVDPNTTVLTFSTVAAGTAELI